MHEKDVVQLAPPDRIEVCPEHGILEGISDEEWRRLLKERGLVDWSTD